MFSGRISDAVAKRIERKIAENNDLNALSNSELAELAIEFVGDAPPSHVDRSTVIEILSDQPEISAWRNRIKEKAVQAGKEKISTMAKSVDPRMAEMIKQQFGQWLQNSGLSSVEITTKIDTNSDGVISHLELNQFIQNLSGTQPPDWVAVTLMSILDKDGDGTVHVQELWQYLGAIGFDVPNVDETAEPTEEPNQAQSQIHDEVNTEIDIDKEIAEIADAEPSEEIGKSSDVTIQPVVETHQEEIQEDPHEVSVNTSIELGIEKLHATRLHRESVAVIESSAAGICSIMIERVERSLMVMDSYRGGMTVTGLLDGGPYTVGVLFEPQHNESLQNMVGKNLTFSGTLFDWSSGLRQAKLKGSDPQF